MDREIGRLLLKARDDKEFLKVYFSPPRGVSHKVKWTYGLLAKRSGFASKSFLHQVVNGKKRMTLESAEKVALGLRLSKSWSEHFKLLASRAPAERIEQSRQRLTRTLDVTERTKEMRKVPRSLTKVYPTVLASMGSKNEGASVSEISSRSRLTAGQVESALKALVEAGLASYDGKRYFPLDPQMESIGGLSFENFVEDYRDAANRLLRRLPERKPDDASAFYLNTFSVRSQDLPELKKQLMAVLREFSFTAENANGDCVAELLVGLTSNRRD